MSDSYDFIFREYTCSEWLFVTGRHIYVRDILFKYYFFINITIRLYLLFLHWEAQVILTTRVDYESWKDSVNDCKNVILLTSNKMIIVITVASIDSIL